MTLTGGLANMSDIAFPPKLSLARLPTPLQPLRRLSALLGGPTIWVKRDDLTDCAVSGNKIRKLEFTLARAINQGCDTLITCGGEQSNHCRATALLGAQLGLKVHLLLRDEGQTAETPTTLNKDHVVADGNLFLDYLAGAEVTVYQKKYYQRHLPALLEEWRDYYRARGAKPYVIPTGASDATGVWGYVHCTDELVEDFHRTGIRPQTIVHATGSGGTQAGLTAGVALHGEDIDVIGIAVCDNAAYFQRKVAEDISGWQDSYGIGLDSGALTVQVDDRFIGPGYAQAGTEIFACIGEVARREGIIFDPVYTGKAFYGLMERIKAGEHARESDIVFIHTGGIFGLFCQRKQAIKTSINKEI